MSPRNRDMLAAGTARLRDAGVPDAARDARRLLAHALDLRPDRLSLVLPDPFPDAAAPLWNAALAARAERQPVAQIIGRRLFYGRAFRVTRDVLDPRPETECLIAAALAQPAMRLLDIGTGSGCILLTLLCEWPRAEGVGSDQSAAALAVAAETAETLGVAPRASFVRTNWAEGVAGPFDLIVSNPPYISEAEMAELSRDVLDWEPHGALSPGPQGLESYRDLVPQVARLLAPDGRLLLEIGPSQGAAVCDICREAGLVQVHTQPDLDGRDRVVSARQPLTP